MDQPDTFTAEWPKIRDAVTGAFEHAARHEGIATAPAEIFHFTDVNGLIGILDKDRLRSSHAETLNDRSEVRHALSVAESVLLKGIPGVPSEFCQATAEWLYAEKSPRQIWIVADPYVVSFCADPDQAIHWLHYGKSGTGIALGFDSSRLAIQDYLLYPVLYDVEQQHALISAVVTASYKQYLESAAIFQDEDWRTGLAITAHMTATQIRFIAPRIKAGAFSAEREWRLISQHLTAEGLDPATQQGSFDIQFREANGRIVPFREVEYNPMPITRIILGASAAIGRDDPGVAVLLRQSNLKSVTVSQSQVLVRR